MGNPTGFYLSEGQASDLEGADVLLPRLSLETGQLIADKAYDAEGRVLEPLEKAGIEAVIQRAIADNNAITMKKCIRTGI